MKIVLEMDPVQAEVMHFMIFPDPNIGYVFGYNSRITPQGILVTFLNGRVQIIFKYANIKAISRDVYSGGRISLDVIRWGKCPTGTKALRILLKKGFYRDHFIVFENLEQTITTLKSQGINIK